MRCCPPRVAMCTRLRAIVRSRRDVGETRATDERRKVTRVHWNFATVWESIADAMPDGVALVQGDRRRTWREFDDRAARLANGMRAAGLAPDSKVASYLYNGNEYLEGVYASFKLRAVPA